MAGTAPQGGGDGARLRGRHIQVSEQSAQAGLQAEVKMVMGPRNPRPRWFFTLLGDEDGRLSIPARLLVGTL